MGIRKIRKFQIRIHSAYEEIFDHRQRIGARISQPLQAIKSAVVFVWLIFFHLKLVQALYQELGVQRCQFLKIQSDGFG